MSRTHALSSILRRSLSSPSSEVASNGSSFGPTLGETMSCTGVKRRSINNNDGSPPSSPCGRGFFVNEFIAGCLHPEMHARDVWMGARLRYMADAFEKAEFRDSSAIFKDSASSTMVSLIVARLSALWTTLF